MNNRQRVLFVSTRNTSRSQMAEAFVNVFACERFEAYSAGLTPAVLNPLTVRVMAEKGLDLSGFKAKGLDGFLQNLVFHHLITVCDDAKENCPRIWPGVISVKHWNFDDPAAFEGSEDEKIARFREIRDHIEEKVHQWLATFEPVKSYLSNF